jgi:hypothetical protein
MRVLRNAALFAVLLYPTITCGTAIFATYQDGALFVGADTLTKLPYFDNKGGSFYADVQRCKLFVTPSIVVSVNGGGTPTRVTASTETSLTTKEEGPLEPLINRALELERTPAALIARLRRDVQNWKSETFQKLPKKDVLASKEDGTVITVFYFDSNAKATMTSMSFTPTLEKGRYNSVEKDEGTWTLGTNQYMATPFSYHASLTQQFVDSLRIYPDAPRRLIEALNKEHQISRDPKAGFVVGPPYTVFRLSVMGGAWIPGNGIDMCKGNTHL